ncbi:hypothetical protein NP233_g10889 [Leucocoprinus birnbaumii]|uniref:Uncharacterized protein n=1 Tax=Leucocoprinus birnbaumii TaxID=56174 RepID=A0AAD5VJX0_9AGAR|nr:hypothetical protein NP233_g10889 [Leucocoprinus birnbaumii]
MEIDAEPDNLDHEAIDGDVEEEEMVAELENNWEPFRSNPPEATQATQTPQMLEHADESGMMIDLEGGQHVLTGPDQGHVVERVLVDSGHGLKPKVITAYSEQYPSSRCGAAVLHPEITQDGKSNVNPYAPFQSHLDWLVARWAKLCGPGSTALSELLAIPGVQEALGLLFKNADELNRIIDANLPERHYADEDKTVWMYHDMHTGKWWWNTQVAYPVYLTISNIPKHIRCKPSRQAQVLLAYLPTTKLKHITSQASRCHTMLNLFHACMKFILQPLEVAGREGVFMASNNGAIWHCFLILATYISDYPEQVLVSLVKTGECPICPAPREGIGSPTSIQEPRNINKIHSALNTINDSAQAFFKACSDIGIKPVLVPFWKDLPHLNIYSSITPDVLHQLYQGVIKHLLSWLRVACGAAEINA